MCVSHTDLVGVATEARKGCAGLRTIYSALEGLNEGDPDVPLPEVNDDDPALLLYTSGTTARPKGVTPTHLTLLERVRLMCTAAPASLQAVLVMTPMAYISAICVCLRPPFCSGALSFWLPASD